MQTNFIFNQNNKANWYQIRDQLTATLNDIFRKVSFGDYKEDFEIEIRKIAQKRSGQQLKAFWILIDAVKKYMNSSGNNFSKEQVAEYFKIESGHYDLILGNKTGKSIANKSDCSKEQMEAIISEILNFGAKHEIEDCYIEDGQLNELLKYYDR